MIQFPTGDLRNVKVAGEVSFGWDMPLGTFMRSLQASI